MLTLIITLESSMLEMYVTIDSALGFLGSDTGGAMTLYGREK